MVQQTQIQSTTTIMTVSGKIFYNDRRRRMDIKKPIRDLFENGRKEVGYIMEYCLTDETTAERLKELADRKIKPVLLYFTEGQNE